MELNDLDYEELSKFKNGPREVPDIRSPRLQRLIDSGYLEASAYMQLPDGDCVSTHYRLTLAGEDALARYEKMRDQRAKDEERQSLEDERRKEEKALQEVQTRASVRASWAAVAQVVVPVITFIIGLLVEHWTGIVNLIFSVFGFG